MRKMICNKAKECKLDCFDKESHIFNHSCNSHCDRKGGIPEAICVEIPLTGVELIAEERKRQIEKEGWTVEHDDAHPLYDMSTAGAIYALDLYNHDLIQKYHNTILAEKLNGMFDILWPWDGKWWKPTPDDPIRQLVKAGALIAAEIDRLQRQKDSDTVH